MDDKLKSNGSSLDSDRCIRCGKCKRSCAFLSKYNLVIGDSERLKELAFHCFLCGRCTEVCPIGIDGRNIILHYRMDQVEENAKKVMSDHRGLVWEKRKYKYRNYRKAAPDAGSRSVFFPGCNFPSLYPKTNAYLSKLLYEEAGIGTAYDCCGKPIAELGMEKDARRIVKEITENLKKRRVDEIVTCCPNCFYHLTPRISLKVTSIYDKLAELGIGSVVQRDVQVYLPCPDRESRTWMRDIGRFVHGEVTAVDGPQCCGLGGSGARFEPELAKNMAQGFTGASENVSTCCASCVGNFRRSGGVIRHILPEILEIEEEADISRSYINRMKTKLK